MDGDFSTLPGAQHVRAYVTQFVARVTERNRLPLDYGVASLRLVDLVVDGLRRDQPDRSRVEPFLCGLGAYTGEVIVRRAGAEWVDFDEAQRAYFGQPVGIVMPDGRAWNPLGKVVNRFEVGPEESVQRFYLMLHGRTPRKVLL
ncbi:hypothetical protein E2C00_33745 [Streptomyces sp. WAC05374]|uniref:hypothetical protein n=1 Tax=unclassified Streptomyces TaxID=2593676 RepID=UPI000F86E87E|nr:hypothetical protein [Streptomyces sp. WAC05374]RST14852.1 hypothetical protein EF905_16490 [Streptomyces sp. WAC05374]TDF37737.1 hypothetical protein E2B92_29545 [Streptomyces sp. WAC05374]TDF45646.1 hypothetical protein E2C02_33260 [Streptomyces sp. WAC05374]TDF46505.1 hypothetical protein E2C00_33745 [Streptomyces sp. WAC05374]